MKGKAQVELLFTTDEIDVDNFAGGGGASTGIEAALGKSVDIAINHDREAVLMHAANHPMTHHFCEDVFRIQPEQVTQGKPVRLAWFSPDCKHFSKAKGGTPVSKKIRGLAWVVVKWAAKVRPRVIMLENVEEFKDWGPLRQRVDPVSGEPIHDLHGKPVMEPNPKRKGETFRRWWRQLEGLGYQVEARQLRACDFGAPTIRKRLFIVARCDGKPIVWPTPTHGDPKTDAVRTGKLLPWRTAAECIDWSIPCPSIFERKKPLAEATMRRIARGIQRYVIEAAEPFIVPLTHQGADRIEGIGEPFKTVTGAHRGERALVAPVLTEHANASAPRCMPPDEPLRTICAEVKGGHHALIAPTLVNTANSKTTGRAPNTWPMGEPLRTITSAGGAAVVAPLLVDAAHGEVSPAGVKRWGVGARPLDAPAPTVTASGGNSALVIPTIVQTGYGEKEGQAPRVPGIDKPLGTVVAGGKKHALVSAFMAKYYSEGGQFADPHDPMATIPTKDRMALVQVEGQEYVIADIGMRMLTPRELYAAQGFPPGYIIDVTAHGQTLTKTAQVRMCGNSVCPPVAEALVRANFAAELAANIRKTTKRARRA